MNHRFNAECGEGGVGRDTLKNILKSMFERYLVINIYGMNVMQLFLRKLIVLRDTVCKKYLSKSTGNC